MSRWPLAIIGALSSIAVLNATVFILAARTKVPFVTEKAYEESLVYDERQQQESAVLGEALTPKIAALQIEQSSKIILQFPETSEAVVSDVSVKLLRPSGDDADRELKLTASDGKTFFAGTEPPMKAGLWLAQIKFNRDGRPLQIRAELTVPGPESSFPRVD